MSVPIGTTPTFEFTLQSNDVDLTAAAHVYVDIVGAAHVSKSDTDLTIGEKTISVFLTQEETLSLGTGLIRFQANWTYTGGQRGGSAIGEYIFSDNLRREVLE